MAYAKAPHHKGPHQRRARAVVAAANADPSYRCPTCGLTRAEAVAKWGANGEWEGGHRVHGRSDLGYWAEHKHCNRSAGASYGNAGRAEPTSGWWRAAQ